MNRAALFAAAALALAGCATASSPAAPPAADAPVVTAMVKAAGETVAVGTINEDAADDPAIWRNPRRPADSLIVGTDKRAGVYVYGLDGKVRDFHDSGRVNNVDLLDGVRIAGRPGVLVVASDRNDVAQAKFVLYRLDTAQGKLAPLGVVPAGEGEAYGVCLYARGAKVYAFAVIKDGTIRQVELDLSGPAPAAKVVRTLKLGTQSEGCAVDRRSDRLYVAEEDVGLWRFSAAPDGPTTPMKVAGVDGARLFADAEGVAIAPIGARGGYVLVSSQGDNAYAAWSLPDERYVGRFRIAAGAFGAVEETDGIDVALGDFGPAFPGGLFVAQDGVSEGGRQNFKLVPWRDIRDAIAPARR